jgi:hypothetical protein
MLEGGAIEPRKYRRRLTVTAQGLVPSDSGYSDWIHAENLKIGVWSTLPEVSHPRQGWEDLSPQQPVDVLSIPR